MANDIYEVKGLKELAEVLEELPLELQRKALRPALREAGEVIAEEARRQAPSKTGDLRKKIRLFLKVDPGIGGEAYVAVRSGSRISHLIEFGASAHKIIAGIGKSTKKALASAEKVFGKSVGHPGNRPKPFLRPAFDTKHREALDKFSTRLRESIISTVKRAAKKAR
jgi:HK97 gp10 family phage protein